MVTWTSNNQDNPGDGTSGVFAQRYSADGLRVGAEFQVNQTVVGNQFDPDVAGLNDGGFVIAWVDDQLDGSGRGIFLNRYDANGLRSVTETQVNSETSSTQDTPRVAATNDGGYAVVWTSVNSGSAGDGSSSGVFLQIFNAADAPVGGEVQVNEEAQGFQGGANIAVLQDGRLVVVWTSVTDGGSGDGSGDGVFARLFQRHGRRPGTRVPGQQLRFRLPERARRRGPLQRGFRRRLDLG